MTPAEFKAWFEGFAEGIDACPTKVQWERVKKRVDEIDTSMASGQVNGVTVAGSEGGLSVRDHSTITIPSTWPGATKIYTT